jgi:hypothetical protein
MVWALLLLLELARLVWVRLLLRHLQILFLETGFSMTLLLYDVYLFFLFSFLGPCIPAGHFVFTWIVVHMALVVYGQCLWLCIYGYMYGCVFMAMCMDVGLWVCMDVFLDVWMCFWLCVYGYGYEFVAMCMDIGSRSSTRPGSSISGLTSPWDPFPSLLGLTLPRGPFQQILGLILP